MQASRVDEQHAHRTGAPLLADPGPLNGTGLGMLEHQGSSREVMM